MECGIVSNFLTITPQIDIIEFEFLNFSDIIHKNLQFRHLPLGTNVQRKDGIRTFNCNLLSMPFFPQSRFLPSVY